MNLYCLPFLESIGDKVKGIIASLIKGIADELYKPLAGAGLSIDSLMNGAYDPARSKAFFSLDTGNIYGVLGAQLFVGTRNIFLILIGVTFMFSLLRAAASPNASNKGEAKVALGNVALAMLIVAWTPAILSFFVWLRKFFLDVVSNAVTIGGRGDLRGVYANAGGKDVTGAILYLAFVGVGIYFAFYYICMAIMQSVMLGILPLTALQAVQDSSKLRSWYQTFLGWMLIPMVDYVLFMVPVGLYMLNSPALVILVSMFALLPVRKFVFGKLGIEGADVAGMVAAGATSAMVAVGKETVNGATSLAKKHKEERGEKEEDEENASLHEGLASAEFEQRQNSGGADRMNDGGDSEDNSATANSALAVSANAGERIDASDGGSAPSDGGGNGSSGEASGGTPTETSSSDSGNGAPIGSDSGSSDSYPDGKKESNPLIDAVYQSHANVNNFDKGPYKDHLSHEQMAAFYRERKHDRKVKSRIDKIGSVGAFVGGTFGFGFGAMYGGNAAVGGMKSGAAFGEGVAEQTAYGVRGASRAVRLARYEAVRGAALNYGNGGFEAEPTDGTTPPPSAGMAIGAFPYDAPTEDGNTPQLYEDTMNQALPERNYESGAEAQSWVERAYAEQEARSAAYGVSSDLTTAYAFDAGTISGMDMLAGSAAANGMIPEGMPMQMNFSNGVVPDDGSVSPNLMYGTVGRNQVAASYLRNADGTPYRTDAASLQAEREAIRAAQQTAINHTSYKDGQFTFTKWSAEELNQHREVLNRIKPQVDYLNQAKEQMRQANGGQQPIINYRMKGTDRNGKEVVRGRRFENTVVQRVMNRPATESQRDRANNISNFFGGEL